TSYGFPTPRCSSAIPPRRPLRSSPGSRPPAARRRGSRARSSNRRLSPANLCSPSTRASLRANRARKERRSTGRGNPVDEIANAPFDFAAWQAVARLYVRQAEIAADDEGAQPLTGQGGGALNAEAAHRLHGRPAADAIENRARHVVQAARLEQGAIGLTRIVLQVDADAVHPGGEHALRRLDCGPRRSLHGQENIGEGEPRDRRIGLAERVARRAHRSCRGLARQREEADKVGAAAKD